jgi:hypothetical protein
VFVKYDIRDLQELEIPSFPVNHLEEDWDLLCSRLENQIFCLFIQSSHRGTENEIVTFPEENLLQFLNERSKRTALGLVGKLGLLEICSFRNS